ncbi:hypothetical protein [Aurantimonas sp. Leaf443]|uniref:hypothetical protein n=1 Tax=Aurantimonas sp. Leaf443 TaxID=1736378 RepID=UPI000AF6883B|nr:hypothetical protein [Aurantimonas sp. Leaf443]
MTKTSAAVEAYCGRDFDPEGPLAADLMAALESEARSVHIRLSEPLGPVPADITPAMSGWYARHVAAPRSEALDAVSAILGAHDETSRARGVFLERELSQEEEARIRLKREAVEASRNAHPSDHERYEAARADFETTRYAYDDLRARHGREARLTPWWYLPLLLFVGVFDAMINFESFSAISYFTPAIALGVTMVVAFAFALSSHCHGTVLRQYESRFGVHRRDADRAAAWQIFSLGTLALLIALALVWYARSSFLADVMATSVMMGGEAPSAFTVDFH